MAVSCFATPTTKTHAKHSCILHRSLSVHSVSSYSFRLALHSLAFAVPLPRSSTTLRQGERSTFIDSFPRFAWALPTALIRQLPRTSLLPLACFSCGLLRSFLAPSPPEKSSLCTQNVLLGAVGWKKKQVQPWTSRRLAVYESTMSPLSGAEVCTYAMR